MIHIILIVGVVHSLSLYFWYFKSCNTANDTNIASTKAVILAKNMVFLFEGN
jgi:hypothetical protein